MAQTLPADAQKAGYDGSTKSYTLKNAASTATIGVLVGKEAFYVCPVDRLPAGYEKLFSINKQDYFLRTHVFERVGLCLTKGAHGQALLDQGFAIIYGPNNLKEIKSRVAFKYPTVTSEFQKMLGRSRRRLLAGAEPVQHPLERLH